MKQFETMIANAARLLLTGALLPTIAVTFALLSTHASIASANTPGQAGEKAVEQEPPIRMKADQLSYDRDLGIVTATGNVEVFHDKRILMADTLSYNERADLLSASSNITLLEPGGEVLFAQYMELSGDMKNGVIQDLRMILQDGARVASSGGHRYDGNRTEMYNAVYSPCRLCPEDPKKPPLWQIKAVKINHDQKWQMLEYQDAWLEVHGVPILYTPYLRHPDPTAPRKTGLLPPTIGGSTELGLVFDAPFYWNIAPNMDATIRPIYTEKGGSLLAGEFRGGFDRASLKAKASITHKSTIGDGYPDPADSLNGIRGHIEAEGNFDIDETWRWGFDINRTTDDTYMRRYGLGSYNTLSTNVFVEGFRRRNYAAANMYAFQNLSSSVDSDSTPLVLPLLEYSHIGEPDRYGGRTNLDLNLMALSRETGTNTRRMSAILGWRLPYVSDAGSVYTLATQVQGDLYHVNRLERANKSNFSGFSGRFHPSLSMEWRHPFVREEGNGSIHQLIEPTVSAVISPYGGNPDTIPNEDSQVFEFDDTHLFAMNRFSGFDRVEGGPRLDYGLKWGVFGKSGGSTALRLGQTYRVKADDTFANESGLEDNFSDVVGSVHVQPGKNINAFFRTRLDKEDLSIERNEVALGIGSPALNVSANYIFFDKQEGSEFQTREQLGASLSAKFTRYWRGSVSGLRDLVDDEMRSIDFGLTYEDECLIFNTRATRTFYEDRDLKPTDAILFTITLKTLGPIRTGITQRS